MLTANYHFAYGKLTRTLLLTLLFLLTAVSGAWGQTTDYSGTYFIANGSGYSSTNTANNFYLVPATNANYATNQPHLTTAKTNQVLNCCWRIEKSGDYYHIIHVADGKFLTANPAYSGTSGNDAGRLRVHLETMAEPDNNNLFEIKPNNSGGYNIRHKDMADKINNGTATYLDPAGGNYDDTNLTSNRTIKVNGVTVNIGGGIGYWTDEAAARWIFEPVPQNNTYTFNIIDKEGNIAVKYTVTNTAAATLLNGYSSIPEAIRSPYIADETVTFYSFTDTYSPTQKNDLLTDENKIVATPVTDNANIYVTYTTDHLTEKFLHLRGARAFNIKDGNNCLYDNSGTLDRAPATPPVATTEHMWNIKGGDPYAVEIQNLGTSKYLVFSTPPTLGLEATATTRFILMEESASGNADYETVSLMAATGTEDTNYTKKEVTAYPVSISTTYHLIDKAGRLIADIPSTASELALPTDWVSPLVSAYHYYKTASIDGGVYTLSEAITTPFDVGDDGDIYVNYDVSDVIDLGGTKTYMMRFSDGVYFNQEDGHDGINEEGHTTYGVTSPTKAVYPYNNGDFNLYVYGQEQWEAQLSNGASTRSRWLWYIKSRHDGVDLTGEDVDPYHVVIKSYQNHTVKDKSKEKGKENDDVNYGDRGSSYLQTYKPSDYAEVVTNIAYENVAYNAAYPAKMPESMVNGTPTEYMILGTSLLNMTLKTFNEVEGERRVVNSFEQYWKNNPTVENLVGANPDANDATLAAKGWHRFTSWAYSAPWGGGSKTLHEDNHWYQTISMGSGQFTFEEVSLTPQVILLDQHGWEIMRVPLTDTETLRKFDSPMVEEYHWYPKADKTTGYHKYRVSNQEIPVYDADRKVISGATFTHNSTTLTYTPYDYFETIRAEHGWVTQDDRVKSDFYVTYTVKPRYASTYTGAATAEATQASSFLLKQGDKYAKTSGAIVEPADAPASIEEADEDMQWYLKPNFDIDREMGYCYAGETGAQSGAKSKNETEQDYYDAGKNGFDPYNVQIQSKYNTKRYFTANTSLPALSGGTWAGTSSAVTLQNLNTKQTATGYDQTTLNITNATFMVVADANGNMRLMPRFDHTKVVTFSGITPFTSLDTQAPAANDGDQGKAKQTLWLVIVPAPLEIHSSSEMTDMNGHYLLAEDFTFDSESRGSEEHPFRGIIDGQLNTISGKTSTPLVAYADGAIIRNVILEEVGISSATTFKVGTEDKTAIGAIVSVAKGATRIYNCGILAKNSTVETDNKGYTKITSCSSSVGGTANYVGGLVGFLDDEARVINCFSYADVSGGDFAGGIVGYNNVATTSAANNLKTMVMNCMFYGEVSGTSIAPIYNGKIISNAGNNGVGNYNYFRAEAAYIQDINITKVYNCALSAETRYLQRFEFFRHLLNSHRELAAWWATDDYTNKDEMAKWVLLPSQIGSSTPYPVLAKPGYYPSVVNIDADNAPAYTERNKGGNMGTLAVTIQMGDGAQFDHPEGAEIVYPSLTLNITDKDPEHFNFNYYKVQLPYYNDVGTKNYTGNRVVTGWKIVSITGGTPGTFSTKTADAPSFNFADRNCTNKDLYGTDGSNRIFNQGAYWDVPEGVTAITIEPYWARCVYLADPNADKVYKSDMSEGYDVPNVGGGTIFTNGSSYSIAGENQVVYTTMGNAIASSETALFQGVDANSHSVYDYAVVLVGNYHHYYGTGKIEASKAKPYTVTSIDLDGDNEPDYSYILRFDGRCETHPVRADFINIPGLGMAQKSTGGTGSYNFGIMIPKGWFESTNTSLFRVTQFEYEHSARSETDAIIVQGGVIEQWVSNNQKGTSNKIPYIHVGGNVWFKEFHTGCHQDKQKATKHSPISVTGGDYDEFYLTGLYRGDVSNKEDNAECYINGGRFGTVCGAAMEGIGKANGNNDTGNITWLIQNADIHEFYAGGLNAAKPVTGNLSTTIVDSHVDIFCGGPKFGDMSANKTVVTNATGCTFGTFFGAGYGGNSYSRYAPSNQNNVTNINWNNWVNDQYKQEYNATYGGVSTQFFYQFLPMSDNKTNVARILIDFVKFSLATTHSVTSTLTDCTITGNFYGGGSLGKVDGPATSTLTNCTVRGNVFGAGYSASLPTVEVDFIGFRVEPYYYEGLGTYRTGVKGATTTYTWEHGDAIGIDKTNHILYTTENLEHTNLGSVSGAVTLTITGNSVIGTAGDPTTGNVYGGGDQSTVNNATNPTAASTTVTISGGAHVLNNVFGGGNNGDVSGPTTVNIQN